MEEEIWRRRYGGGDMEEEIWRRRYGGRDMEDEIRRRYGYVSSAVRSPLIQLILLCVHSYTVDLTTVMEFLLVCTNISTTDFNLSCELPLDSFCDFQNGPAFPRPCIRNYTGSLTQKGRVQTM